MCAAGFGPRWLRLAIGRQMKDFCADGHDGDEAGRHFGSMGCDSCNWPFLSYHQHHHHRRCHFRGPLRGHRSWIGWRDNVAVAAAVVQPGRHTPPHWIDSYCGYSGTTDCWNAAMRNYDSACADSRSMRWGPCNGMLSICREIRWSWVELVNVSWLLFRSEQISLVVLLLQVNIELWIVG